MPARRFPRCISELELSALWRDDFQDFDVIPTLFSDGQQELNFPQHFSP